MSIELKQAAQQAINAWTDCGRYPDTTADIERLDSAICSPIVALNSTPRGDPAQVEMAMRKASEEFDAFLIGHCKGEPPRMSMAFASALFKTIIRERGLFFPAPTVQDGYAWVPVEPTDAMLTAAARASMQHLIDCINDPKLTDRLGSEEMCKLTHASRYRAMIAAAQAQKP